MIQGERYILKRIRDCRQCGVTFLDHTRRSNQIFCCQRCAWTWHNKNQGEAPGRAPAREDKRDEALASEQYLSKRVRECVPCGNKFLDDSQKGNRIYCSAECKAVSQVRRGVRATADRRNKTCEACGKVFTDETKGNGRKYCSAACRERGRRAAISKSVSKFREEKKGEYLADRCCWCGCRCLGEYCCDDHRERGLAFRRHAATGDFWGDIEKANKQKRGVGA